MMQKTRKILTITSEILLRETDRKLPILFNIKVMLLVKSTRHFIANKRLRKSNLKCKMLYENPCIWIAGKILCRNFYNCILRRNVVILKFQNFEREAKCQQKFVIRLIFHFRLGAISFSNANRRKRTRHDFLDLINSNRNNSPRDTR